MPTRNRFTMKDIHKALYWIPSTTVYDRVKKGLCPVISEIRGDRKTFVFSKAGLVHVAVVDALASLGLWGGLVEIEVRDDVGFVPDPNLGKQSYSHRNMAECMKSALRFYEDHQYLCGVLVDIRHLRFPAEGKRRQKRSPRYAILRFCHSEADLKAELGVFVGRVHIKKVKATKKGVSTDCWTSGIINVSKILRDIEHRLELRKDEEELIWEGVFKEAAQEVISERAQD